MNKIIQTNLCKGLRACGVRKGLSHRILNVVSRWVDNSGIEWTNSRIKDLRQWYETCCSGNPKPPSWFKHGTDGYPLGVWKEVFNLPTAKALGVLSLNTSFVNSKLTEPQKEKFFKGLEGNHAGNLELVQALVQSVDPVVRKYIRDVWPPRLPGGGLHIRHSMPKLQPLSIMDIPLNKVCPVGDSLKAATPHTDAEQLELLRASWESCPQVTFDFLVSQDRWDILPLEVVGNKYQLELNHPHASRVGRIGVIQEPQLKARIVANPNRVTQHTLHPLRVVLEELDRALPSTCIHDQDSGMRRLQNQIVKGTCISGSDLTSASDLLDLEACLWMVDNYFELSSIKGYVDYVEYFKAVSRAPWYFPHEGIDVCWKQGDPLGTEPSIFLLDLANTCAALTAWGRAVSTGLIPEGTGPWECFGTLGDDIWMLTEMQAPYERVIGAMGGEINHSKTLTSNIVAEFAGRIITSKAVYLKKVNYSEPGDNSFMSYVSQLGPQAKWLLRPRQRRVWDLYSPVPGVAVSGPWNPDSFGLPLSSRYLWYLEEVAPVFDRGEPDASPETVDQVELRARLRLEQDTGRTVPEEAVRPILEPEDYPSSIATEHHRSGDPRTSNGRSLLEVLEEHGNQIKPYTQWVQEQILPTSNEEGESESESSCLAPPPKSPLREAVDQVLSEMKRQIEEDKVKLAARERILSKRTALTKQEAPATRGDDEDSLLLEEEDGPEL